MQNHVKFCFSDVNSFYGKGFTGQRERESEDTWLTERQEEALRRVKGVQRRGWAWDSECSLYWVALARQLSHQTGRDKDQLSPRGCWLLSHYLEKAIGLVRTFLSDFLFEFWCPH